MRGAQRPAASGDDAATERARRRRRAVAGGERPRHVRLGNGRASPGERPDSRYSCRYSRSRRVCDRLTGISVAFGSFIFSR